MQKTTRNNAVYLTCMLCFIHACITMPSSQQEPAIYTITVNTLQLTKSKQQIDSTATYEMYFNLNAHAECIDISVIAQDRDGKKVRCAFILESRIDLSRFQKKPLQPVYSEIAKNFDSNWRFQSNIFVCTDISDPLKRLAKGNYRLKISAFSGNYYTFTINIKSSVPVEFRK